MGETRRITIGIPKGSLQEHTLKVFERAGFHIVVPHRGYFLQIDDPELQGFLLRPQEIPVYVEKGQLDVGITGEDWIAESQARVLEVSDLRYAKTQIKKVRWVLAASRGNGIKTVKDLEGKTVSTEIVHLTKEYFKKKHVRAKVEFSFGATEAKPPRFADAIVDLVETGISLKVHNLKVLDTVFESSTLLIANKKSWADSWKKEKIKDLAVLLEGAVESETIVGVMFHAHRSSLLKILKILPSLKEPSVTKITNTEWYDVFAAVHRRNIRELIPELKKIGCTDIVEFPLNKAVV